MESDGEERRCCYLSVLAFEDTVSVSLNNNDEIGRDEMIQYKSKQMLNIFLVVYLSALVTR